MAKKKAAAKRRGRPPKKKAAGKPPAGTPIENSLPKGETQTMIAGAFPDREDEIEALVKRRISTKEKAAKLGETMKTIDTEISQAMQDCGLEDYSCYDSRFKCHRRVESVSVTKVPEKEATPFEPTRA